jgi:Ca-activated chloride channel family protein
MSDEGRIDYVRRGLHRAVEELKAGDTVSLTLFDTSACQLAEGFVVGRDDTRVLHGLIDRIEPLGSTNLYDGLSLGYAAAARAYRPGATNRVVLITDALANTGVTNQALLSMVAQHYDAQRIRLSGIGVGRDFNDSLLDELTERGRGAYVFLGSEAEVDAVFGSRFASLIETIATDVHFRLHLPPSLALETFHGEEASVDRSRVQAIHYFAGTTQLFLSDLRVRPGSRPERDEILLEVTYRDAEREAPRAEYFVWRLGDLPVDDRNVTKARLVSRFAEGLADLTGQASGGSYDGRYGAPSGLGSACAERGRELRSLASALPREPEASRVTALWDRFCTRFPASEPPAWPAKQDSTRNNDYAPVPAWPGAQR